MPLKLSLKPHEKILIGTAIVANGPTKTEIVILNRVPVLRQKDILTEEEADTVAKGLYLTILNMYIHPDQERNLHEVYFLLLKQLIRMPIDPKGIDLMVETSKKIIAGDHYQALKICRKLIELEAELLKNVNRSDQDLPGRPARHDDPSRGRGDGLDQGGQSAGGGQGPDGEP